MKSRIVVLLGLLTLNVLPCAKGEEVASLRAGTAKVEITPAADAAVDIFGKKLQPREPLHARVLVLKSRSQSLAIVSLDLLVFASPKVVAEAKAKWGVDHVILSATHTHAGMTPKGLLIQPPMRPDWTRAPVAPADFLDWPGLSADPWYADTEAKVVTAIGQAMTNLFPARLVAGKGSFESAYMAHNRRLVKDGKGIAMWDNPDRRPTSPIDPTVGVLRIDDYAGKPRAFAVHYACHPVTTMTAGFVSRDFPGAMVDYLEKELGPDCMALFLQGAQGDLDPYDMNNLRGENRFNIVRQAGISLGKGALRVAASLKSDPEKEFTMQVKESLLTLNNRNGKKTTDVGLLTVVLNRNLALVAAPCEPFIQHQLDLSAKSTVPNSLLMGLAYHGKGTPFAIYVPTVQAVKEGGYGAGECSFLAADAGERIINESVAAIRSLTAERDLATPPAEPNFAPGPEYADNARKYQGVPALERAPNGRLWATWYSGGVNEDRHNYVMVTTSGDDGKSWQTVLVLDPDGDGPMRAWDPCLWHDPSGKLWLFWAQERMGPVKMGNNARGIAGIATFAITTTDSGKASPVWTKPRLVSHGVMLNKPTVTAKGQWLMPIASWGNRYSDRVVTSPDQGVTFTEFGATGSPDAKVRAADEHIIVERKDGSLWMLVRGSFRRDEKPTTYIGESLSHDGGKTWTDVKPTTIPHPVARFCIRRLASGRLLLVRNNTTDGKTRSHLTAYLSEDDGATWKGGLLIDERDQVAYPDIVQAADGSVYMIYDRERRGAREILMAVFTEQDVLDGKATSAKSRMRVLINKATGDRSVK